MLAEARIQKRLLSADHYIPAQLLGVIDAKVASTCAEQDGAADRLIQNPAACRFEPSMVACRPGQTSACLTAAQVETLTTYLTPLRGPDGSPIYPGYSVSDLAGAGGAGRWTFGYAPPSDFAAPEPWGNKGFKPAPIGYQFTDHVLKDVVEQDPSYNLRDVGVNLDGRTDPSMLAKYDGAMIAGSATDVGSYRAFLNSGRKMILYHGFSDPALTPYRTIQLYEALASARGGYAALERDARLFMVPGMHHCEGGPGPNTFDTLTALETWVEHGQAPEIIMAYHHPEDAAASPPDRSMPLCAFPTEASYDRGGDVRNGSHWSCKANTRLLQIGASGRKMGLQ